MDKLEQILEEILDIEHSTNALIVILKALEVQYEVTDNEELNALICLVKRHTEGSLQQLARCVTELDTYIIESE